MQKISHKTFSAVAVVILVLIAAVAGILFYPKKDVPVNPEVKPPSLPVAYGIRLDSMAIARGTVAKNQNLSVLMGSHVSALLIDRVAKESGKVFDIRKIKAGNNYARIYSKDSSGRTLFFIYEINPIDFVVFDFRDSVKIYKSRKKVSRLVKTASGTITSSLWSCFVDNKLDVNLALSLSDVYAWTIDFYGLQKGDNFKVIYEELFVDQRMIGIDRILASTFQTNGKEFHAYHFEQEGKGMYFDENGQSLQRSFLKAPLKFSRISSKFSRSRMHPILRIARPHYGVDYSAPRGTPVVALGDGHVNKLGFNGGYGRFISIRHNSVYTTTYAHLSGYSKGMKNGTHVQQGQVIGFVGSSGLSTGPHLDFRVYKNGSPTDPLKLESPPARPVDPKDMPRYNQLVAKMNLQLAK